MEKAPVTVATGALGPVIAKLTALLGSEYKLRWCTRRDVKFIRSKLKPVHSLLWDTWEREDFDAASKALKMKALDLADDMEDVIDDFILGMERSRSNKRFKQTKIKGKSRPFKDFKKRASDVSGQCRSKWKKKPVALATDSSASKPRAYPFVRKDASELVLMEEPRDKLAEHLVGEDESAPVQLQLQLKTASIFGTAGMGKTTLAHLVYDKIQERFQARAFVTLTPGGSMKEVLARILEQVQAGSTVPLAAGTEASTEEHLIDIISNSLKDKRYLVIIDDIWNWREWEIIMKSLPENNLGSRVVRTTRMKDVADKWSGYGPDALVKIDNPTIALRMIFKADLMAHGFNCRHPIVNMCGGTPLAVICMFSAITQEQEKQAHKGLKAHTWDVQDKVEKHVKEHGIQNTPGYEPLVESLQLVYDYLPHHMIKTCLMYYIHQSEQSFSRDDLVSRWISEGFVYGEEEANGYFEELVNGGLLYQGAFVRMHPMVENFLAWKSRQDNFVTRSSEITSSYTGRIRRLSIDNLPSRDEVGEADPLFVLDWGHIRSLVVNKGIKRVPLRKLEGLRVLDLCWNVSVVDDHLKDICGLVRLRHLFGLDANQIRETPPEIVRLQCLETFQVTVSGSGFPHLPSFIENLQKLKTLDMNGVGIKKLPKEIGVMQQLKTLRIQGAEITELPREMGGLQQLKTLNMSWTKIRELPKEIGGLQQLKTLDMTGTVITMLPKEIGKLQHLEHLLMSQSHVANLPREIGALKELKTLALPGSIVAIPLEVCQVSALVKLPQCIYQALKKSGLASELAREMLSFQTSGGLVVGAKHMCIPPWIREHFNELTSLDIRVCKLEEKGLKILREMPKLKNLLLRFQVVPREPVVISGEGFTMLKKLTVDSRVPRVTFQKGDMPALRWLTFQFQFHGGPPSKDPVGINHLIILEWIKFECNENWYRGGSPCIGPTIDVVRKEAQELPKGLSIIVSGRRQEYVKGRNQTWLTESPPPPFGTSKMGDQKREMEQGDTERSSGGTSEIEESLQALFDLQEEPPFGTSEMGDQKREMEQGDTEERSIGGMSEIEESLQALFDLQEEPPFGTSEMGDQKREMEQGDMEERSSGGMSEIEESLQGLFDLQEEPPFGTSEMGDQKREMEQGDMEERSSGGMSEIEESLQGLFDLQEE